MLGTLAWAQPPKVEVRVTSAGKGPPARVGDVMAIAYRVTLADGTFVEETGGTPYKLEIGASDVIPGLSQGLVGITRGETRTITIPPELAYGAEGSPPTIPPNATLVFEVEGIYRSSHTHDHDHDHDETKGEHNHSSGQIGDDGSHGRPSAANLDRPAISEFMIRDFYTRPWQYDNAAQTIWKDNAVVSGVAALFLLLAIFQVKRTPR